MSVSLDATADVHAGVALVTARVSNPTPVPREVRLRNRLDGPLLPPRRRGVPASGWSDEGFEGVVPAEGTLAVGYACPVGDDADAGRPLELVSVGAPSGADDPPAARARRGLDPARPPRDAVPLPDRAGGADADPVDDAPDPARVPGDDTGPADPAVTAVDATGTAVAGDSDSASGRRSDADAFLDAVERRVALGERLTDASVAEATAALADADGTTPVADLPDALAADVEALTALAARAERLAERAEATDVPVDALRRLA